MADLSPEDVAELQGMVRRVLDGNRYLTLGTVEPDGRPRLSPVYFTHQNYRAFYWVSSPDAQHSHNVEQRPSLVMVVFDSSADPPAVEAVYLTASPEQVPQRELVAECAIAFRAVGGGARAFAPEELAGDAPLRLYRATATSYAVHIRGRHPKYGTGIDRRVAVDMP